MLLSVLGLCLKPISADAIMAQGRIGTLKPEDRRAVFESAQRLGLDPYEFGALIHQESGFRPNVWGGAGGQYRGLIQFGPGARSEVGLPSKPMTIAEQLPYVEKYFQQRGYKPGMGIAKAYATVLGGNPNVSLKAKDAFGTSVESSLPRFKPGGSLYQMAQTTLGDPLNTAAPQQPQQQPQQQAAVQPGGRTYIFLGDGSNVDQLDFIRQFTEKRNLPTPSGIDYIAALTKAMQAPDYSGGMPQ